jgi:predicted transcriptional regulator
VEHRTITLTADIVSAHVANNDVAVNQLGGLIRAVPTCSSQSIRFQSIQLKQNLRWQ